MTYREVAKMAIFFLVSCYTWATSAAIHFLPMTFITLNWDKNEQYIESPNYPNDFYPNSTQVMYRVEVKLDRRDHQEQARIQVTFEVFLMEKSNFCEKDGLDVVDRNGKVRTYCGAQSGLNFLVEDSMVVLRMYTDGTGRERGFRIRFRIHESKCFFIYGDNEADYLQSPGYPGNYRAHTLCVSRMETWTDKRLKISFMKWSDIRSDNNETCFNDYLEISTTGNFQTDSHRYCGKTPPPTIVSKANRIAVKFVSDCCEEGGAFLLRFEKVPSTSVVPPAATDKYVPISCQLATCGIPQLAVTSPTFGEPNEHMHPWVVAIFDHSSKYICTGSLISSSHVLTTAHCCANQKLLRVMTGDNRFTDGLFINIQRCVMHPAYTNHDLGNNIAVLVLTEDVAYTEFQRPICLPVDAEDMPGLNGTIAGWSHGKYGGPIFGWPVEAVVPFISHLECAQHFGALILPSHICAGGGTADACQGENGGPLMSTWHSPGKVVQMGIITTGIGCGGKGHPGIYIRTTPYHDFIYNITGEQWCSVRPPNDGNKSIEYKLRS